MKNKEIEMLPEITVPSDLKYCIFKIEQLSDIRN